MQLSSLARLLAARAGLAPVPHALGLELTHRCNLACRYCDRHTPLSQEMTPAEIMRVLTQFIELGTRHVSLDGGEPLTHPHVAEIVDMLTSHGVRVYMHSNGILVPRRLRIVKRVAKVKISLDGPAGPHDAMRGTGSFAKALRGAEAARGAGVAVELTCVVGLHNIDHLETFIDFVEARALSVVFQPVRPSLFLDGGCNRSAFVPEPERLRAAFEWLMQRKRTTTAIANGWSSLRHFRSFPDDTTIPCAAGFINATLDPEGVLFHCGQVSRRDRENSVVKLGARAAFARLVRQGCSQCWCARVVEENWAWGGRLDRMLPLRPNERPREAAARRRLSVLR